MIFVHGFMGDPSDWDAVRRCLKRPSMCVDGYEELKGVGVDAPVHIHGYSMGGRVALQYALDFPSRVKLLTLESTSPGVEDRQERFRADLKWVEMLSGNNFQDALTKWYAQPVFSGLSSTLLENLYQRRRQKRVGDLLTYGQGAMPSLWERICELQMPAHFITGARDKKYCDIGQRLGLPLHIVDGCGHIVHLEAPKMLASILERC